MTRHYEGYLGATEDSDVGLTDDLERNKVCNGGTMAQTFNPYEVFQSERPELWAEGADIAEANRDRLAECWNQFVGKPDPAAHMREQEVRIAKLEAKCQSHMTAGIKSTTQLVEAQRRIVELERQLEDVNAEYREFQERIE